MIDDDLSPSINLSLANTTNIIYDQELSFTITNYHQLSLTIINYHWHVTISRILITQQRDSYHELSLAIKNHH